MSPTSWEIVNGVLSHEPFFQQLSQFGRRFAIISDDVIGNLHGDLLREKLAKKGIETLLLTFPSGEQYKTRYTKEKMEDALLERGFSRDTCLIALGGGVVTDLAGYVAATYCRGIPLFLIPTSLLAMVDACIGGKTGVNVPNAKNMIGAIYHPKKIWIDPVFLKTLPFRELKNGIVEMIKHGLIRDAEYFSYLENHSSRLLALETPYLEEAILKSIAIKEGITAQDEREIGPRVLLNFGHTIGHALEALTDFKISHGEAVAIGIVAESYLSFQLGYLAEGDFKRILATLKKYEIALEMPSVTPAAIYNAMRLDKKARLAIPHFSLLSAIGQPYMRGNGYCFPVEEDFLKQTLDGICHALRCC